MGKTLKELAEMAGVSIATVSKVLNNKVDDISQETAERIRKLAEEVNYIPNAAARAVKTNRSKTIGLIIPDIRNPFFTEIARGAEDKATELGYSIFLCNTDDNFEKELSYIQKLREHQIDGIILSGSYNRDKEKELSLNFQTPIVALDRSVGYKNSVSFIGTNNYDISKELANHLVKTGKRRFLYLGGPQNNDVTTARYQGVHDALVKYEDAFLKAMFKEYSIEFGMEAISQLSNIRDYDAIICGNDMIAYGVLKMLSDLEIKVPEEIAVTGFDNIILSKVSTPPITTVDQHNYELGQKSVEVLVDILNDKEVEEKYILKENLIIRESSMKK